jgi:streptogrisin B
MSVSRVFRRLATLAVLMIALIGAGTVAAAPAAHAASWPPVGSTVCHVGRVSGTLCGVVTAVNVVIAHPDGSIDRVFLYNACAQPGDGGAPIFRVSPWVQIGTVLGTVGQCRTAGLPLP